MLSRRLLSRRARRGSERRRCSAGARERTTCAHLGCPIDQKKANIICSPFIWQTSPKCSCNAFNMKKTSCIVEILSLVRAHGGPALLGVGLSFWLACAPPLSLSLSHAQLFGHSGSRRTCPATSSGPARTPISLRAWARAEMRVTLCGGVGAPA